MTTPKDARSVPPSPTDPSLSTRSLLSMLERDASLTVSHVDPYEARTEVPPESFDDALTHTAQVVPVNEQPTIVGEDSLVHQLQGPTATGQLGFPNSTSWQSNRGGVDEVPHPGSPRPSDDIVLPPVEPSPAAESTQRLVLDNDETALLPSVPSPRFRPPNPDDEPDHETVLRSGGLQPPHFRPPNPDDEPDHETVLRSGGLQPPHFRPPNPVDEPDHETVLRSASVPAPPFRPPNPVDEPIHQSILRPASEYPTRVEDAPQLDKAPPRGLRGLLRRADPADLAVTSSLAGLAVVIVIVVTGGGLVALWEFGL